MITLEHVSKEFVSNKKYPGFKGAIKGLFSTEKIRKVAVDDISFHIQKGEIVGYIGSNGAGKSTTIKMMTGILTPTHGQCMVNGINPNTNRKANAQNIGVVFGQRTQLWWDLPLSESFTILKEIYNVSDQDYKLRMAFLNEIFQLSDFYDRPVRTLSLGQRMRADLAAALLHNPKVLYLDEPTIGLDLVVKDNIRNAIKQINSQYDTTVILTTHDIEDIEELCSRIIIIDKGKKIYDGTLTSLKDTYGTKRKVTMEVKKSELLAHLNLSQMLGISPLDCESVFDIDKNLFTVVFDKRKIQVAQVINTIMGITEVTDIQIQDTELGEIVKAIYQHDLERPREEQQL